MSTYRAFATPFVMSASGSGIGLDPVFVASVQRA